jgi:hypothetical protein
MYRDQQVALDYTLRWHFFAGFSVDAQIADAMPRLLIWLKLIFSESEVAGYRATGNEGKAQEPLPIGAGCHEKLLTQQKPRIQNSVAGIVLAFK